MNNMNRFLFITIIVGLIPACQQALTPEQVAMKFWTAVINKNTQSINRLISEIPDSVEIGMEQLPELSAVTFGKIIIDKNLSEIETHVTYHQDSIQAEQLVTYLVLEDEQWKIDYSRTLSELNKDDEISDALEQFSELGEAITEGLNQSIDELNEALPKIEEELDEMEEKIETGLPEILKKLEEFSRKLEELFNEKKENEETETTEI